MFKVNHAEAKGGTFEPIPVGEYEVFFTDVEVKNSGAGNPMIKATLTVRDDIEQPARKRKVWDNLVATSAAMWKFQQLFKALGFEDGKEFPGGINEVAAAIKHQPVRVKIKHEQYIKDGESKTSEKIDYYSTSQVGGRMNPAANTSDPFATGTAPISDDDLPF
jgi:hypothetical protein